MQLALAYNANLGCFSKTSNHSSARDKGGKRNERARDMTLQNKKERTFFVASSRGSRPYLKHDDGRRQRAEIYVID